MAFDQNTLIPSDGIENLFNYLETSNKGTPIWFIIFDLAGGKVRFLMTLHTLRRTNLKDRR